MLWKLYVLSDAALCCFTEVSLDLGEPASGSSKTFLPHSWLPLASGTEQYHRMLTRSRSLYSDSGFCSMDASSSILGLWCMEFADHPMPCNSASPVFIHCVVLETELFSLIPSSEALCLVRSITFSQRDQYNFVSRTIRHINTMKILTTYTLHWFLHHSPRNLLEASTLKNTDKSPNNCSKFNILLSAQTRYNNTDKACRGGVGTP